MNENTGYVVGDTGVILKTINAGVNWTQLISGTTNNLNDTRFLNELTGYAIGRPGKILKTTNGGLNWFDQISGTTNSLNSIFLIDANTGVIAADV